MYATKTPKLYYEFIPFRNEISVVIGSSLVIALPTGMSTEENFALFVRDPRYSYEDFSQQAKANAQLQNFCLEDFTWTVDGFGLCEQQAGEYIAQVLDDKFITTQNITYWT